MNRLEQLIEPFHLMTEAAQLAFVRALRESRATRKVRPSEAKATKRSFAKKQTKVLQLATELQPDMLTELIKQVIAKGG